MLTQKAKELGLSNTKYYVDDGYTGTNFNRPAFQELLDDIEMGYISVVIVRDLSRLGRDYVSVGHYTDNYFPEHNVRFATVYKGNIIKNLIMDCQSYTKYRPNETTGGIFVSWRRKEELPTGA